MQQRQQSHQRTLYMMTVNAAVVASAPVALLATSSFLSRIVVFAHACSLPRALPLVFSSYINIVPTDECFVSTCIPVFHVRISM